MNAETKIAAAVNWRTSDSLPRPPYETLVHVRLSDGSEDRKATFAGFWKYHCRPALDRHGVQRTHVTHYRLAEEALRAGSLGLAPVVRVNGGWMA